MALTRVHDPLSITLVRKLGGGGGPRHDQVAAELDSIIAFANTLPRCIKRDFSTANSSGVGPDVLHTYVLDSPDRLTTDGDWVEAFYAGGFSAGNDRDKAVRAQFDGQDYEGGGVLDIDNSTGWLLWSRIMRTSATTVQIAHLLLENQVAIDSANAVNSFTLGFNIVTRNTQLTVANLNSNAITMRVRSVVGAGAAAADVSQNMSIITVCKQ